MSLMNSDDFHHGQLNTILNDPDCLSNSYEGITTSMIYIGLWLSTFCAHTEDLDLASINTLVYGAPKIWYCVPPKYGYLLEKLAKEIISRDDKLALNYINCKQLLRHKTLMFISKGVHHPSIISPNFTFRCLKQILAPANSP